MTLLFIGTSPDIPIACCKNGHAFVTSGTLEYKQRLKSVGRLPHDTVLQIHREPGVKVSPILDHGPGYQGDLLECKVRCAYAQEQGGHHFSIGSLGRG